MAFELLGRVCAPKSLKMQVYCQNGQVVGCTKLYANMQSLLCKTGEQFWNIHVRLQKRWSGHINRNDYTEAFIDRHNAISEAVEYMKQIPDPQTILDKKARKILELAFNQIARDNVQGSIIQSNALYCVQWDSWFRRIQTIT